MKRKQKVCKIFQIICDIFFDFLPFSNRRMFTNMEGKYKKNYFRGKKTTKT